MLPDEELYEHFRSASTLDATVRSLIEVANTRGGVDNITAILVEVKDVGPGRSDAAKTDPRGVAQDRTTDVRENGESTAVTLDAPPPKKPTSES